MTRPFHAVALTLFPEIWPGPLGVSLVGRALEDGIWRLKTLDFRDFARDKHRSVDAPPFGGGPGLIMRPDIAAAAIDAGLSVFDAGDRPAVVHLTPRGRPFDQARARALAERPGVIVICGRFEGVDERALEARSVEEIAVSDAVMTGGDIPAMAVLDAVIRLLPGVVGDPKSLEDESFAAGLLEHPHYTRPAEWEGRAPPSVLLSGDHAKIAAWRRAAAERTTEERRPDLWRAHLERAASKQSDVKDARGAARENGDD